MSRAHFHEPHHPNNDAPEEFESGALPVGPDQGPVPAPIPDDPEHTNAASTPLRTRPGRPSVPRRQVEVAGCP